MFSNLFLRQEKDPSPEYEPDYEPEQKSAGREYLEFEVEEPLPDFDYNVLLGIDETDVINTMLVIYLYF